MWDKSRIIEDKEEKCGWNMIEEAVSKLADWARFNGPFSSVFGVPRGGLIPAVMLSHKLNIPLLLSKQDITPQTLVVDDISDTGATLAEFKKQKKATIYFHAKTQTKPDTAVYEKTDKWIKFAWEE